MTKKQCCMILYSLSAALTMVWVVMFFMGNLQLEKIIFPIFLLTSVINMIFFGFFIHIIFEKH